MNCKPGDLAMVVKPVGDYPPNFLLGMPFKLTTIDPRFEKPCWGFEGPKPTGKLLTGYQFTQAALPDECLMPISPPSYSAAADEAWRLSSGTLA